MNRNKIALLLVILLGGISIWFFNRNNKTTLRKGLRNFALEDTAQITKLFLADKNNNSVTLVKKQPGLWQLNDKYYARNDAVKLLLETMKTVEVKSPVSKSAQENVVKALASGGIKIEAYAGDKLVKIYYVGSETQDMMGTYMLLVDPETMENSLVPYVTYIPGFDGYLTTRYFTNEKDWRDHTIFRYTPPEIKSVKVEFPSRKEDGFEIVNLPGTKFMVKSITNDLPLKEIDTMAVKQYISYFQNIQYELFEKLDKGIQDSVIATTPINIITVTDIKGKENTIKIFYKNAAPGAIDQVTGKPAKYDNDRIFALANNGADFVTIQYYVFGKLLQPVGYFIPKNNVKK